MDKKNALNCIENLRLKLTAYRATGKPIEAKAISDECINALAFAQRIIKSRYPAEMNEGYPQNLLLEIVFLVKDSDVDNITGNIVYVLDTLKEREKIVIIRRFKEGLTLEQVGKEFGVNRERIRQIEANALRKLRHPARACYIATGEGLRRNYDELQAEYNEKIENLKDEIRRIEDISKGLQAGKALADFSSELDELGISGKHSIYSWNIEELDLSIRPYNCLKRAGVNTVGELMECSVERLMKMRNMGRKSLDEIIKKIGEHGLKLRYE